MVPQFHGKTWGEQGVTGGGSSLDGFGAELQLQAQIMKKQANMWRPGDQDPTARPATAPATRAAGAGAAMSRRTTLPPLLPGQAAAAKSPPSAQSTAWPSKDLGGDGPAEAGAKQDLLAWLEQCRAIEWLAGLQSLGVVELGDLADVEESDLIEIGLKAVPRRRLLKAIAAEFGGSEPQDSRAQGRPQSAPAWDKAGGTRGARGAAAGSAAAGPAAAGEATQRPASAAAVRPRQGWGEPNELQQLQAQARQLEEDSSTGSSDEGVGPEEELGYGSVSSADESSVEDAVTADRANRGHGTRASRRPTGDYPGGSRAAQKGAKARAALAAAREEERRYDAQYGR